MAGMYPNNQVLELFGEDVQWPGVNPDGKFTNGSFTDPMVKPSFIPAETINLILDNMTELIKKCNEDPNSTTILQLAGLITNLAEANKVIQRDEDGRAQINDPLLALDMVNLRSISPVLYTINGTADVTVTLPDATADLKPRTYLRRSGGSGRLLFATVGGQTIGGKAASAWPLVGNGRITIVPVAGNWEVLDYETGPVTFTPSLTRSETNPSLTYISRSGIWVQRGKTVWGNLGMIFSVQTPGSGVIAIDLNNLGLPPILTGGIVQAGYTKGFKLPPKNNLNLPGGYHTGFSGLTIHWFADSYGAYLGEPDALYDYGSDGNFVNVSFTYTTP
jgi:hypothetical protein